MEIERLFGAYGEGWKFGTLPTRLEYSLRAEFIFPSGRSSYLSFSPYFLFIDNRIIVSSELLRTTVLVYHHPKNRPCSVSADLQVYY
jgi:hypothetical protein